MKIKTDYLHIFFGILVWGGIISVMVLGLASAPTPQEINNRAFELGKKAKAAGAEASANPYLYRDGGLLGEPIMSQELRNSWLEGWSSE